MNFLPSIKISVFLIFYGVATPLVTALRTVKYSVFYSSVLISIALII